jgi:hypothetical protein
MPQINSEIEQLKQENKSFLNFIETNLEDEIGKEDEFQRKESSRRRTTYRQMIQRIRSYRKMFGLV